MTYVCQNADVSPYVVNNKLQQQPAVKNETGQDRKNANYLHKCIDYIGKMLTVKLLTLENSNAISMMIFIGDV